MAGLESKLVKVEANDTDYYQIWPQTLTPNNTSHSHSVTQSRIIIFNTQKFSKNVRLALIVSDWCHTLASLSSYYNSNHTDDNMKDSMGMDKEPFVWNSTVSNSRVPLLCCCCFAQTLLNTRGCCGSRNH